MNNRNDYLIPANSKKSMLYLNLFNRTDLIIFGSGILAFTILLIINFKTNDFRKTMITIAPLLFCSFLVIPLPNVHNVRTLIKNIYIFFTNRRTYYWKGWSIGYGKEDK